MNLRQETVKALLDTANMAFLMFRGALEDPHDDSYNAAEEQLALVAQHALTLVHDEPD